jgi:hypothetical protein
LREYINETITLILEEKKFVEDSTDMNLRILTGVLAVIVALISQFYKKDDEDWKFPKNKGFQMCCVLCYIILMGVYYYIDNYMAGNTFFKCKEHPVSIFNSL